jgi:hypothetical protein
MSRRVISGVLTGVGGVCAVVIGLAAIDDRVRQQVVQIIHGQAPSGELVAVGQQVRILGSVLAQSVHDQSIAHAPMVAFAAIGAMLVVFMLRVRM